MDLVTHVTLYEVLIKLSKVTQHGTPSCHTHMHNFNKSCKVPQVNATLSQVFRTSDLHVILICYRHYLKKKKIGVVSGSIG